MPLPFIVAAGIAAIGVGVGAVANEARREREEERKRQEADGMESIIAGQLANGNYSTMKMFDSKSSKNNIDHIHLTRIHSEY